MPVDVKRNRSYRVVPGDDLDALAEAAGSDADAVLLDLEDSIPPDDESKERARERVVAGLTEHLSDADQYTTVRVNGLDTKWGVCDIETLATAPTPPDSVSLPKVRSATEPQLVADLLSGVDSSVRVVAIVEEAAAVFNVHDIARSTPRLDALVFGSVDFRRSAGMPAVFSRDSDIDTAAQKYVPRVLLSLAASAAGVAAVDGGYYFTDDLQGLREDTLAARTLGFDGKAAATAEHVAVINDALGPTERELRAARRVVRAFEDAADVAKLELDGVVVERSHYEQQKALLERAGDIDD
jgi:citrate lyase subunit beta/citryl-CoA lyase